MVLGVYVYSEGHEPTKAFADHLTHTSYDLTCFTEYLSLPPPPIVRACSN